MIAFLLGVAVGTAIALFNLPFLIHYVMKEHDKDEAREGEDRP